MADLPPVANRITDVDIPNGAWSSWIPAAGSRQLRRALTDSERSVLERRRDELAPAAVPYGERDVNRVTLALTDMYGGFPSLRARDDESVLGRVDAARRVLSDFPAWAIEKACRKIQSHGVWRDGKFDRQWPPSDPEIVAAVRDEAALYSSQYRSAVALLDATVEE